MVNTKEMKYSMVYVQLNEIIKNLSLQEIQKLPDTLIMNIRKNIDNSLDWKYDKQREIYEQDLLVETKAMLIEIYEKYLCSDNDKTFWKKYDKLCLNMIENKKRNDYNTDEMFKNRKNKIDTNKTIEMVIYKESIFDKIRNFIKRLFR